MSMETTACKGIRIDILETQLATQEGLTVMVSGYGPHRGIESCRFFLGNLSGLKTKIERLEQDYREGGEPEVADSLLEAFRKMGF